MNQKITLLAPLFLFGCQDVDSKSIYTQAMDAEFDILIDGDSANIQASLVLSDESPRTYVELTGTDSLQALVGDATHQLVHDNQVVQHSYSQVVAMNGATEVQIEFRREYGEDAIDSTIKLPPRFTLASPVANQLVAVGNDLEIKWDPTGSEGLVDVRLSGDCIGDYGASEEVLRGVHVISGQNLMFFEGENSACSAEISIEYASNGELDPMFNGGYFTARRIQKVNVVFVPSASVPSDD